MAYSLSFAEAFFWGSGTSPPEPTDRPTSVHQALVSLPPQQWAALARDEFGVEPEFLDIETVIERVIETDTCTNLDSPVEVWIDGPGWWRLLVYDES